MELSGKPVSEKIRYQIKEDVATLLDNGHRAPHCVVILVGDNPASQTYVKNKEKAFKSVGMISSTYLFDETITQAELIQTIQSFNQDDEVDAILVQLPLPQKYDEQTVIQTIDPQKDVDGLTHTNQGKLLEKDGLVPCTPAGIIEILKYYEVPLEGKNAVIIGRSALVGRPISLLLQNQHATVTVCHSKTKDLENYTKNADVLVVAMGQAEYIKPQHINDEVILVDVGIHRTEKGIVGDCHKETYLKAKSYTPVPGGVGVMTVTMLLKNTLIAYINQHHATV